MRPMPRWAIFLVGMYAGVAVATFGFQAYIRLANALDIGNAQSVLRRVPSGRRSGQHHGRYIPLDCNAVLRPAPVSVPPENYPVPLG
jgi:hypothetical protein